MSDHGIANGNNCTALAYPEEAITETLRPLAERIEQQDDKPIDASNIADHPVAEADSILEQGSVSLGDGVALEAQQVEEETLPGPSQDGDPDPGHEPNLPAESHIPPPPLPPPSSCDVPSPVNTVEDTQSHSEGLHESPAPPSPGPDSFSESFTHVSPSPEDPLPSLLSPLTLGGTGYLQDEEELLEGAEQHPNEEGLGPAEEKEDEAVAAADQARSEVGRHADSRAASSGWEEVPEVTPPEEESGVSRRSSLLAALDQIGQREDEEEAEEEFQIPQRAEEEAGFSLNKCILGAVILVGLGTIFFSGVFMDLDNEGEYDSRELRDVPMQGKQDWPNPEVPVPPVDVPSPDHDKQLAKDDQHIATLHAQLQAQKEELKVAKGQSAEGAKERQRKEEVEKENGRLKKELASLAALHKENERMKRELESVAALQREVETLRATVTGLRVPTATAADPAPAPSTVLPPSGQAEISSQDPAAAVEKERTTPWQGEKKEKNKEWKEKKYDQGEKAKDRKDMGEKEWKEGGDKYQKDKEWKKGEKHQKKETEWKKEEKHQKEEKEWKKGGGKYQKEEKEWKKGGGKYQKEEKEWKKGTQNQEKEGKGKKDWNDKGEWKKEKTSRGGEGRPWGDKKEWKEEREDEGKKLKNYKYEKRSDGKDWKSKSDKGGQDEEWWKGKDEWNLEKEWKKEKDGKESRKGWKKDKWESKEWKQNEDYKHGHKEGKGKENEWSKDGEPKKKGWKEERKEDWRKDRESQQHHHKDGHKHNQYEQHHHSAEGDNRGQRERAWQSPGDKKSPHTHRRPPLEQPDYWEVQRERLQHSPKPQTHCSSVETCAQAEGLLPVPLPVFEAVLQEYLTKAEEAGVEASRREELSKLVTEFFKDGVFAHHQMSFLDFVEDVGDILEDMVERDGEEEDEEDEALEEEMEGFEAEMLKTFALQREEEKKTGEWKKKSGRGHA